MQTVQNHWSFCLNVQKPKAVQRIDPGAQGKESDSDTEDSDGYKSNVIEVLKVGGKPSLMKVQTNGHEIHWQPDTGTQKNIWDVRQLAEFERTTKKGMNLQKSDIKLYAYGSKKSLTVLGKFPVLLQAGDKIHETTVYVTKEHSKHPLLSETASHALDLVKYNEDYIVQTVRETVGVRQVEAEVTRKFPDVFSGKIGRSTARQVEIMTDRTMTPIVQKSRRIPVNLIDKAEDKVKELLEQDIIERFPDNEPRTWVSPPVIAPKPNGDIHFCIDMRLVNKSIQRPFTQIPTMEDVRSKFLGAERYSKLDLKESYHQFELVPESRNLTTFYGPDGLYRYKRLNYGTKSSQDILQIEMQNLLAGIQNQVNLADDILIGGTVE